MRIWDGLLIVLFSLVLCLPGAAQLGGLQQATAWSEQRPLAPAPAWPARLDAWRGFVPVIDGYLANRIGFRPWLLAAAHRLRYAIGAPVTHDVVIGKGGWLFYGGDEEIEQHLGLRPLTGSQIRAIVDRLDRYRRMAQAQGASFVFVIAPDKSSIYPEDLPDGLHPIGPTPADQLMSALAGRPEIPVVDGREVLRRSKNIGPLYLRTDSHWNEVGAFVTLEAAISRVSLGPQRLRPLSDYRIALKVRPTDLLRFLDMGLRREQQVPVLLEKFAVPWVSWRVSSQGASVSDVITRPPPALGRVLVIGDSFSLRWLRFLGDNFARVVRAREPTIVHDAVIEAEKPDLVILEIVERSLLYWRSAPEPASASAP